MADRKQSQEFLGGSLKFNQVGRDARAIDSVEEPLVPVNSSGHWGRVGMIGLVVVALAATLFFLNSHSLGKTTLPIAHPGGHAFTPDSKDAPPPPSLQ